MKAKINSKSRSGLETIILLGLSLWLIVLPVAVRDFMRWLIATLRKLESSYAMSEFFLQVSTVKLVTIQLISNVK